MPLDPGVNRLLRMLNSGIAQPRKEFSVKERRAALEDLMRLGQPQAAAAPAESHNLWLGPQDPSAFGYTRLRARPRTSSPA